MEVIVGKTAGFCFGVVNAVNKANELLNKTNNNYCLGELVHNRQVTDDLKNKGLQVVEDIKDAKGNLIIRSHGATKNIYEDARRMELNIVDLTCPKVLKTHKIAEEYSQKGYYIFLIGKKTHPEILATISYCGDYSRIIENKEELQNAFQELYNSKLNKLLVIVQTTFSFEKYNEILSYIKKEIDDNKNIILEIKNTICSATRLRQEETKELSSKVDFMIIIGGKHSSNTNKLYEISKENCINSLIIEDASEINKEEIKEYNKIGIMAGASTPQKSIEAVVEMLKKLC